MTEVSAIASYTTSPSFAVLPKRLYMDTFLPTELAKIGRDVTRVIAPKPGGGKGSISEAFNYSAPSECSQAVPTTAYISRDVLRG